MTGNSRKKGQVWSIDLIIGLLVFVLIIVTFYSLISTSDDRSVKALNDEAELVTQRLLEEGIVDSVTGEFDEDRFLELANEDYQGLKERLGITGDFCLFVETNDAPAKLKIIVNETSEGWTSIGNPDLNVSGYQCGDKWP